MAAPIGICQPACCDGGSNLILFCYTRIRYAGSLGRVARQVCANVRELGIADLGLAPPTRAGPCPAIARAGSLAAAEDSSRKW